MNTAQTQPVLFIGHGSPMNAILDNPWSRAQRLLASKLPRPEAILAISAHWQTRGLLATSDRTPATIHDFSGFPRELFEVGYPAPGSPDLATRVVGLLASRGARNSLDWGLDHGTWSVLVHLFPDADVPVVQLSLDANATPTDHVEVGRILSPLREEGVLILASGNTTHNLGHALHAMGTGDDRTPAWAGTFDSAARRAVAERDEAVLTGLHATPEGRLSHPHPDHWWPLLVAFGASRPDDPLECPVEGFDLGSLSMRSFRWG